MVNNVDNEIEAIRAVLSALEPLDAAARESVLGVYGHQKKSREPAIFS